MGRNKAGADFMEQLNFFVSFASFLASWERSHESEHLSAAGHLAPAFPFSLQPMGVGRHGIGCLSPLASVVAFLWQIG